MGQRTEQRSLRVLLAPSTYYPRVGGIEELTRQLALALKAKGHEASVLTNRWTDDLVESELLDSVDVTRLRFPLPAAHPRVTARFMIEAPGAARGVARQRPPPASRRRSRYWWWATSRLSRIARRTFGRSPGLHNPGGDRREGGTPDPRSASSRTPTCRTNRGRRNCLLCAHTQKPRNLRHAGVSVTCNTQRSRP